MRKLLFVAIGFLIAACSGTPDHSAGIVPQEPISTSSPTDVAKSIAAEYANVRRDQVNVRSIQAVEFSDSSLGCPNPDMSYLQVITPGYKAVVTVDSKEFDVRISGAHGFICAGAAQAKQR